MNVHVRSWIEQEKGGKNHENKYSWNNFDWNNGNGI